MHSGYGIVEVRFFQNLSSPNIPYKDTFDNRHGTNIDGQIIRSRPIVANGKIIGYRPDCGQKHNSDYMSLYSDPFVSQIQKWIQNESLIPLQPGSDVTKFLGPVQTFKSTIEPRKPRGKLSTKFLTGFNQNYPILILIIFS